MAVGKATTTELLAFPRQAPSHYEHVVYLQQVASGADAAQQHHCVTFKL